MRDDEITRRYGALQDDLETPASLKARTMAAVRREEARISPDGIVVRGREQHGERRSRRRAKRRGDAFSASGGARPSGLSTSAGSTASAAAAPAARRRRLVGATIGVAVALIVALALAFGTFGAGPHGPEAPFAVKAYAASTDSVIDADAEGRIIFPLDLQTAFQGAGEGEEGIYTGAVFTVEGEGMQRVQATLTGGEIYRYEFDEFVAAEEPDKMAELVSWKPTRRGYGSHYGGYDNVTFAWADDGLAHDDPAKTVQARLIKRLGSTIDVEVAGGEAPCLGLWFVGGAERETGLARENPQNFAGENLTVTVQFEDGRCETQVIGLRAGTFAVEDVPYDAGAAGDVVPVGDPVIVRAEEGSSGSIYILYGVVEFSFEGPHPYSLERANARADAPVEALDLEDVLDAQETTNVVELSAQDAVNGAGERDSIEVVLVEDSGERYGQGMVLVKNVEARVANRLPEGYDLAVDTAVSGMFGDLEYYNACRRITHGYEVAADGTLSEGFSYLVVDMDMRSGAMVDASGGTYADELGRPAALDVGRGIAMVSTMGAFACKSERFGDGPGSWSHVVIPANEEYAHIELVFIVSDELLASGELALQLQHLDDDADGLTATKPGYLML